MLLECHNLHFSFGDESIFEEFSFSIQEGEHVVLKGESGSGKSTLFQLLLGFERPESGTIHFEGKPLNGDHLKYFRKKTAWLPQDLNIGRGSVEEVILYPFQFKSTRNKPNSESIHSLLKALGLDRALLEKDFTELSTGQRQRIGILICLLMNKPLMLLDEPTSALDLDSKEKLANLILNSDRTILSTSHDPFWIERCDRVIEMQSTN